MIQLFKEYYNDYIVPYCNDVKEYYNEMIVPYWDDVKECFKEFVIGFKSQMIHGDAIMSESFEVEIHTVKKQDNTECNKYRYMARWCGGQYITDNIICHISAVCGGDDIRYGRSWTEYESRAPYETTFKCHSRTLDGCISEAESVLKDCLFGKAELLDGKYRVATVTKRYDDDYTCSNLTKYGTKCKKSEP